jgi:S1-C subfamily serine protease
MSFPQVVKIYATTQAPNFDCPWQADSPSASTGSGVIIAPGLILTGAHVVSHATFLQVQKYSDANQELAKLHAVCHEADLALLSVDKSFTKGVKPASIGELPELGDTVSVVGFPVGGEEVSITEGVISRIEVQQYEHSKRRLLAATVDAAINEGNSGGPVFMDDEVVGIAFQTLKDAENIGEIVPPPLIRHFLEGTKADRQPEIPGLGIGIQNLENPLQRKTLGMKKNDTGVLITQVEYGNSAWGVLKPGDTLLALGGQTIANNGTIRYRDLFRTKLDVALCDYYVGDTLKLKVLRDGKKLSLKVELMPWSPLVPRSQYDLKPQYLISGGLVFQSLTRHYLETWEDWWEKAPNQLLNEYYNGTKSKSRREVVVLTQVLADELNLGYDSLDNQIVKKIEGKLVSDLAGMAKVMAKAKETMTIELTDGCTIVLDAQKAKSDSPLILERYQISKETSLEIT